MLRVLYRVLVLTSLTVYAGAVVLTLIGLYNYGCIEIGPIARHLFRAVGPDLGVVVLLAVRLVSTYLMLVFEDEFLRTIPRLTIALLVANNILTVLDFVGDLMEILDIGNHPLAPLLLAL